MVAFFQGRAFRALTAAAVLATAGLACADTRNDRVANAGARYVYLGQSAVIIPEPAAREEAPYALTGNRDVVRDEYRQGQGRWIEAGQSKVFLPPTR